MTTIVRYLVTAVVVLAYVLALAGCGTDSDPSSPLSGTTATEVPR